MKTSSQAQVFTPEELLSQFPKGMSPEVLRKGTMVIIKPNFTAATSGLIKDSRISVDEAQDSYEDYLGESGLGK